MKDAIGNAYLFNMVIIFIGAFSLLLVGSAAYSKAFKVKDSVIDIIDQYDGDINAAVVKTDEYMAGIGYRLAPQDCSSTIEINGQTNNSITTAPLVSDSSYDYCVYRVQFDSDCYYRVITYMRLELPVINRLMAIPVSGETKTFSCS